VAAFAGAGWLVGGLRAGAISANDEFAGALFASHVMTLNPSRRMQVGRMSSGVRQDDSQGKVIY
jgi:hypothetical protein